MVVIPHTNTAEALRLKLRYAASMILAGAFSCAAHAQTTCDGALKATRDGDSSAILLLTDCVSSSEADSLRAQALQYRAWLYFSSGNFQEAAFDQEKSLSLTPSPSYESLINHSLYLRRAQRFEESLALAKLAQAVESRSGDTTSMMTQYHLGWSYFELGRYDEAVTAFSRGIPFQPDYSAVYWLRAQSYEKLGDKAKAEADLRTLNELLQTPRGRRDLGKWLAAASEKLKALGLSSE